MTAGLRRRALMLRVRSLLLVSSVVLAAVTASCASDPWNDPALGDPWIPEVKAQRRVGRLFEGAYPSIPNGSGGGSIASLDFSVWLLGDVVHGLGRNRKVIGPAFVSTQTRDWPAVEESQVIPAALPLPGGTVVRWTAGMATPDGYTIHYVGVQPGGADEPALDYLGAGVATLEGGVIQRVDSGTDWRFFGRGDPAFGLAIVQADHGVTTGMDYVFGVRGDAGTNRAYLARTPHGRTHQRDQYTFLDQGGEWSDSVKDAVPMFEAGPGGLSVSWNKHLGGYFAVYARVIPDDGVQPPRLRVFGRSARHPSGPWSDEMRLFEVRGVHAGGRVRLGHGAREHPQLQQDFGRIIFVSVDGGPEGSIRQPKAPRMFRVEFPSVR